MSLTWVSQLRTLTSTQSMYMGVSYSYLRADRTLNSTQSLHPELGNCNFTPKQCTAARLENHVFFLKKHLIQQLRIPRLPQNGFHAARNNTEQGEVLSLRLINHLFYRFEYQLVIRTTSTWTAGLSLWLIILCSSPRAQDRPSQQQQSLSSSSKVSKTRYRHCNTIIEMMVFAILLPTTCCIQYCRGGIPCAIH